MRIPLFLTFVTSLWANSTGPQDGYAGDPPGALHCASSCHTTFPVNSGDGQLTLSGVPEVYVPLQTYVMRVFLADSFQKRWGFELTVKDSENLATGTLIIIDSATPHFGIADTVPDYLYQT